MKDELRFERFIAETDEQRAMERVERMITVLLSWREADARTRTNPRANTEALFEHARAGLSAVLGVSNQWRDPWPGTKSGDDAGAEDERDTQEDAAERGEDVPPVSGHGIPQDHVECEQD